MQQFLRYSLVEIISNFMDFCFCLLVASTGLSSIQVMSLIYTCSCLFSFAGNKKWSFGGGIRAWTIFPRYVVIQIAGYLTNLLLMSMLYNLLEMPNQLVQLIAIAVLAIELFLPRNYYVFRKGASSIRI